MGQKVHPTGFRIGIIYGWQSNWFAERDYHVFLQEDIRIRGFLEESMRDASVAKVEIERNANVVTVTIHTAKPGIVIGRGGQKVDELRKELETLTSKRIRVNIQEIRMPELDAVLVARNIADQLERRIAFRRALRQTVSRTMARGAEGCKAMVSGRLGGAEMSRSETTMEGRVPLHTMRADIDFGLAEARTTFGRIGVKVWIYKGEKLPEAREAQVVAPQSDAAESETTAAPAAEAPAAKAAAEAPAVEAAPAAKDVTPAAMAPAAEAPAAKAATEAPAAEAAPAAKDVTPAAEAPAAEEPAAKAATEAPAVEAAPAAKDVKPAAVAPKAKAATKAPAAPKAKAKAKAKATPAAKAVTPAAEATAPVEPETPAEEPPAADAATDAPDKAPDAKDKS